MLPRHVLAEHHIESLANAHRAALLGIEAARALSDLGLRTMHAQIVAPLATPHSWTPSCVGVDLAFAAHPHETLHEALHILTEHYTQWVSLFESQLHLNRHAAHRAVDELEKWSPRGTESALAALDLAVDAAESSAETLAEASVVVAQTADHPADSARPSPRNRRSRTSA